MSKVCKEKGHIVLFMGGGGARWKQERVDILSGYV